MLATINFEDSGFSERLSTLEPAGKALDCRKNSKETLKNKTTWKFIFDRWMAMKESRHNNTNSATKLINGTDREINLGDKTMDFAPDK